MFRTITTCKDREIFKETGVYNDFINIDPMIINVRIWQVCLCKFRVYFGAYYKLLLLWPVATITSFPKKGLSTTWHVIMIPCVKFQCKYTA